MKMIVFYYGPFLLAHPDNCFKNVLTEEKSVQFSSLSPCFFLFVSDSVSVCLLEKEKGGLKKKAEVMNAIEQNLQSYKNVETSKRECFCS